MRRRSWGASRSLPIRFANSLITCQTSFSVTTSPQHVPALLTFRKSFPAWILADPTHWLSALYTQSGIGMVCMWWPLPARSNDCPVPFALLDVIHRQLRDFVSPQAARHKNRQQRAIALASQPTSIRRLPE